MEKIATALSSGNMGSLLSSTEAPTSIFRVKSVETCHVIKLRSGKEYEESMLRNKKPSKEIPF